MSVTLELPDNIGQQLLDDPKHAEPAIRLEIAIALYRDGKLPPGRAAQLAGLERWEFEKLLVSRQIEFPMSAQAAAEEIQHALRRR